MLWVVVTAGLFGLASPESPDGTEYTTLFDGQSLAGWERIGGKPGVPGFTAENGLLICHGDAGGWLGTTREYADFTLELEFRLAPGSNSGIYIRAPADASHISRTGLEIQLLDEGAERHQNIQPWQKTGAIYHIAAPRLGHLTPAGEWNTIAVVAAGPEVAVILNGHKVVEDRLDRHPELEAEHTGLKRKTGRIGLQSHNGRVEFRNIRLIEAGTQRRPHVAIRGIYGGVPTQIFERGQTLADYGVNAVWVGSGGLEREDIARLKQAGAKVFAEFNTMHESGYLKDHPDAAPIGPDGAPSPPPDDWQGVCPTHPGYRKNRMDAFTKTLADHEIDGIWLDYHHAHASWEQDRPNLPDTCFCDRCLAAFEKTSGIDLGDRPTLEKSRLILGPHRDRWVDWRCDVFTDWVREFREIRDRVRPAALLGSFHCPWSESDHSGALREKLAIDLKEQAKYLDVLSPMPYHARFGHVTDPAWISRQTEWLGKHLGIRGEPGDRLKIWPIVQLSDWGEKVPALQVATVLDHGTRRPATGVMVFVWGSLAPEWNKVESMGRFYRAIMP
jgi:hypothetical protein